MRWKYYIFVFGALLGLSGCATHYSISEFEGEIEFGGGTVWNLHKGNKVKGVVFSGDRFILSSLYQYCDRFTPSVKDIEAADKILGDNIDKIIHSAKRTGTNYYLRNRHSIERYFRQYIGLINERGERQIYMVLYRGDVSLNNYAYEIGVLDGGDSYFTVLINLDRRKLDGFNVNGIGG